MNQEQPLREWLVAFAIFAAAVFAWHYWPVRLWGAPAPASQASFPEGSRVVVTSYVRGCWWPGGHCEGFGPGTRLIAERRLNGNVLVLRPGDKLGYWIPDNYLRPERAP